MSGLVIGFIFWEACGIAFIILGFYVAKLDKAINVWANVKEDIKVKDIESYNRDVARLFYSFGTIFMLLGLPFLTGKNSPYIVITILGSSFASIYLMARARVIEIKHQIEK